MESSEVDEIEILEQAAASIEAEAAAAQAGPLTEEAAIAHIMNDDWFVDAIGSTPEPGKVGSLVHAAPLSFFGGIGSFIASAEAVNPVQAKEESCKEPEVENDEAVEVAPHQESTAEMQPEFANHEEEEAASRDQPTAEVQPLVVIPAQSEEASRKEPVVEQKQQDEEEPVRKEPAMHKGRRIKVKVLPERPKKVQESRSERVQAAQPEVDAEPETQPEEEPAAEHEQQEEAQPEDQSQAELAIEPQEQQEAQPGEKRKKKGKKSQPQPEEEPEPEPKPSLFNPDQPTMFSFTQTLGYFMAALQTLNLQNLRMAQQEADDFGPRIVELHDDEAVAEATETQAPEGAPVQMPVSALLPPLSQPLFAPFVPTRRVEEPVAAEEIEEKNPSSLKERRPRERERQVEDAEGARRETARIRPEILWKKPSTARRTIPTSRLLQSCGFAVSQQLLHRTQPLQANPSPLRSLHLEFQLQQQQRRSRYPSQWNQLLHRSKKQLLFQRSVVQEDRRRNREVAEDRQRLRKLSWFWYPNPSRWQHPKSLRRRQNLLRRNMNTLRKCPNLPKRQKPRKSRRRTKQRSASEERRRTRFSTSYPRAWSSDMTTMSPTPKKSKWMQSLLFNHLNYVLCIILQEMAENIRLNTEKQLSQVTFPCQDPSRRR
ncbi:hypothetical protein L596_006119 [Steinernema carpocapsae]|uniref:Uncharacterized protein n=1 Tax=Steinernema carpocapsae TaxID=34508 RepID=A0A4U8V154_STECR|nr:hypothetical protein L596_006119 [Steinernema carpocapsae]